MAAQQVSIRRFINTACWIVAILVATLSRLPAQQSTGDAGAEKELQQTASILLDRDSTVALRDQAAQRLVSRGTQAADAILIGALNNPANREARLSVARALASASSPKPRSEFVAPLAQLLGDDPELSAAAARALAGYRDVDGDLARRQLTQFAGNRRQTLRSRTAAIRAMGRLVDKRTAEALMNLLRGDENPLIRDAAVDALTEMTGLPFARDRQRWISWWEEARGRDEAKWATDLLNRNSDRAAKLEGRISAARKELVELLGDEYQRAPQTEQVKRVQARLLSESEDVRWAAVAVLYKEIREKAGINTPPEVLAALRGMIGDSAADVRAEAARALAEANDDDAIDALLVQLAQEKEPDVQAAILKALGPMHDVRAVDPLLKGLDSEYFAVAKAAAESIRSLAGGLREPQNKTRFDQIAQKLLSRLRDATDSSAEGLRASIVESLAALGPPSALRTFQTLCLSGREQAQVRRYAVRGIAMIGLPESANIAVEVLRDPDRGVRLEALDALSKLARFENAEAIGRLLSTSVESDTSVREKAWEVLSALFERASPGELNLWAARFRGDTETDRKRRLRIYQVLEKKLDPQRSPRELADCRQNLGIEMLKLERPDEAATRLRAALDYWRSVGNEPSADYAMQLLMETLLRSRKFTEAAKFATEAISIAGGNATSIWIKINAEIERLKKERDYDTVLQLIEEVKKIPLAATQKALLPSIEQSVRELKTKQGAGGRTWVRQESRHEHAEIRQLVSA